jgi:dihydrofolate reductase/thymidylate synthase
MTDITDMTYVKDITHMTDVDVELIVAVDKNYGIGYKNQLPWKNKEELNLFRLKTMYSTLIMGRKTFDTLPEILSRQIICLSNNNNSYKDILFNSNNQHAKIVSTLEEAVKMSDKPKIFITGGRSIYKLALERPNFISKVHLSIIKDEYICDTHFDVKLLDDFIITEQVAYVTFDHYVLERNNNNGEREYLNLLENILRDGRRVKGRNGYTLSTFTNHMFFNLREGFPLITTKKMFLKGIVEELLFFLRGDTDSKILEEKGINIWKGNTSKEFIDSKGLPYAEGIMGPLYGWQFRNFNSKYKLNNEGRPVVAEEGIDQLANVIKLIKEDPTS